MMIERVRAIDPDVVVLAGDLTTAGYEWEYEAAARWAEQIEFPKVVIPGNHDARNVGYVHFERLFGEPYSRFRTAFDPERAERLRATGFTIVGLDSSEPDVNEGRIGRDRYPWIAEQFDEPNDIRILAVHHHLVPIPGNGPRAEHRARRRRPAADADIARRRRRAVRAQARPYFWGLNGMLLCNSGTAGNASGSGLDAAVLERAPRRRLDGQGLRPLPGRAARAVGDLQPEDARDDARVLLRHAGVSCLEPASGGLNTARPTTPRGAFRSTG